VHSDVKCRDPVLTQDSGKAAAIGGTLRGKRFSLTVEAVTSEEFGPFDHGRLWLGDLSAKAEKPWIEFKVPGKEIRFAKTFEMENLKTDAYVRGIVVTRKGEGTFFCLTNPIWIKPESEEE